MSSNLKEIKQRLQQHIKWKTVNNNAIYVYATFIMLPKEILNFD